MKETMKSLADSYASLTAEVIKSGVRIENILKTLDAHEERILEIKGAQDSCPAKHQIKGVWARLKHFEDFQSMIMSQTKEDSKAIDVYAQRVQHAADLAATQDNITLKASFLKVLPWVILAIVAAIVLTTLVTVQALTGNPVVPTLPTIP
jgi:phage-related tail protein